MFESIAFYHLNQQYQLLSILFFLFSPSSILLSFFSWPTSFLSRFLLLRSLSFLLIFLSFIYIFTFSLFHFFTFSLFHFFTFSLFHFFTFSLSLFLPLSLILPYSFFFFMSARSLYALISNSDSVPLVSKAARILAFLEEKLCLVWLKSRYVRT